MAIGIKYRLYIDGDILYEGFNLQTVEFMKNRLIQAGFSEERLRISERVPNV